MTANNNKIKFSITEKKRCILIVEDDFINQEMLKESLQETYDLVFATSGEEAIDLVRQYYEKFSIILLDLNLPGIKGTEVLKQIKANPAYARIPVIVMTSDYEAEVECLTLGAIDFISKPYPASKVILARILRTVELSEDRDILKYTERDNLTGLYNKEFFFHYVEQLDLQNPDEATDAIVVDVNHFHTINERFGRAFGDEVLKTIAARAKEITSEIGGIVYRSGADTFMLYSPHYSEYEKMLEKLSLSLDNTKLVNSHIRLRMGIYANVDKKVDIERRFDYAKMAADTIRGYLSNSIGFYDHSMREKEVLSEQLIDDFPTAIKEKQFLVYFQPKFNIQNDKPILSSAEALVRWKHPKLGLISPGLFIPLFENNGLIQELDHYVWQETAIKIKEWKDKYNLLIPVSVNVSRIDLYDSDLQTKLLDIVKNNKLNPSDLLLEITESAYIDDAEQIVKAVDQLHQSGFRIEMDDFGSGYSSLSMLSSISFDAIKLDMQFIRSAFRENKDTRLLEVMIQLAASFKVPTIAEGVETLEQLNALKKMGCDIIQGYYFSKPLPSDEFIEYILKNK